MQDHVTPRALETDEIPGIVEEDRRAAANARRAGFDGVEVHSADDSLLEQSVRDSTNKRTDRHGGSIENRPRFPREAVRAAIDARGGARRHPPVARHDPAGRDAARFHGPRDPRGLRG